MIHPRMKKQPLLNDHPFFDREDQLLRKFFYFSIFFTGLVNYEGDPLSPPEGEAAQEVHPLDPPFALSSLHFLPFQREFLADLMRVIAVRRMPHLWISN